MQFVQIKNSHATSRMKTRGHGCFGMRSAQTPTCPRTLKNQPRQADAAVTHMQMQLPIVFSLKARCDNFQFQAPKCHHKSLNGPAIA